MQSTSAEVVAWARGSGGRGRGRGATGAGQKDRGREEEMGWAGALPVEEGDVERRKSVK